MTLARTSARPGAAHRLAALAEDALGGPLPVRLRAWDGSETGPAGAPVVVVRSRRALRRLLWEPGELGLALAYVTGELDLDDLAEGLRAMWTAARLHARQPSPADRARAVGEAMRLGAVGTRPPAPASQARLRGVLQRRLEHRVEVVCQDHRDIAGSDYDAVATVEMGEHVGDAEHPAFASCLHRLVRPMARVLVQQMSRGANAPGGGAFIAPDMHMRPMGETAGLLEAAGLEVRSVESMREHYVGTINAWHRTLEERCGDLAQLVGEETARAWRLYLVGGALACEQRRMGVDQFLCVRTTADGGSGPTGVEAAGRYQNPEGR